LTCLKMLAYDAQCYSELAIFETYLFDLVLVCRLEDTVAGNVVSLTSDVLAHLAEKVAVGHTHIRQ
jgi:hypothetical protein